MTRHEVPHDPEAERSLLTTLCAPGADHAASMCVPFLSPEDFFVPAHRAVFEALKAVLPGEVSLTTMSDTLDRQGSLGKVGGFSGLATLLNGEEVGRPQVLVEILTGHRRRRDLLRLAYQIEVQGQDSAEDPEDLIHQAQGELARIMRDGRKDGGEGWMEVLHQMASFEPFRAPGAERGGWWGLPTLDQYAPIPVGEYVTIGARPGVGKTALFTQVAIESARKGIKPLTVSLELNRHSLKARLASYLAQISVASLKRGDYGDQSVQEVGRQAGLLEMGRLNCPTAGTPWPKLEAMIRAEVDRYGVQLVLLDQFDKIGRPDIKRGSSEAYAFGAVSTGIMGLAQELGIGFVLCCQLKGDAEGREPTLSDHADSDRPGKDAGVVFHLWRNRENILKGKLQKNRDGSYVGKTLELDLLGHAQRFREVDRTVTDQKRVSTGDSPYDA